jgi:inosine-uridine nucleoside N-ribohydrolase
MTPVAEFNIYGDPDAAADIFNLSSPSKANTAHGRIPVSIVPLDQSNYHTFTDETFNEYMKPLLENGHPLAVFLVQVMVKSFEKITRYSGRPLAQCHDPLTIYALVHPEVMTWETLDVRVETTGLWTRGQTVVDGRGIPRWKVGEMGVIRDNGDWLHGDLGNQIDVLVGSGDDPSKFGLKLLNGIFESSQ